MEDLKPVYIVSLGPGEAGLISLIGGATVSYTHLTLPTICSV